MKKLPIFLFLAVILTSCQSTMQKISDSKHKSEAEKIVEKMTLREQIGQLIMLDFRYWQKAGESKPRPVEQINDEIRQIIKDYQLGGVILFRENLADIEKSVKLTGDLQKNGLKFPLFIATDQEGGYVTRLQKGTEFPGNMALGATRDPALAEKMGVAIGKELKSLGINFNFAPVIDVNSNQDNPIIGVRSFGDDPKLVAEMGDSVIKGLKSTGIIATVKHFPGHGNTASDSHLGLATVDYDKETWEKIDKIPFESAISAGVDAIMTAHVTFPALDNSQVKSNKDGEMIGLPATLSRKILTDIVRDDMNFDGLIVTDALNMHAISQHFGKSEAVIKSLKAGADIMLMPEIIRSSNDVKKLEKLFDEVEKSALNDGNLRKNIVKSATRAVYLKLQKGLTKAPQNQELALRTLRHPEHRNLEKNIARKAVTLLKNDSNLSRPIRETLPFHLKNNLDILFISETNKRNEIMIDELQKISHKTSLQGIKTTTLKLDYKSTISDEIFKKIVAADYIIMTTYNLTKEKQLPKFISLAANQAKKPLVSISTRNPYDIIHQPYVKANLAIYGITGFDRTNSGRNSMEINIRTAIRTIFTHPRFPQHFNQPKGKLPVKIKDKTGQLLFPSGFGLNY